MNADGTSWIAHTIEGDIPAIRPVDAADLDGDGDLDVLAAVDFPFLWWWENKTIHRSAVFPIEHTIDGDFDGAASIHTADLDGDGDLDVLGAAYFADDVTWWENLNGTGASWTAHTIDGGFDGPTSVLAAGLDGDGDLDVMGAAYWDSEIRWWENLNGTGTSWATHTIANAFDGAYSVYAADLDNDGDLDVLAAANLADDIKWWENLDGAGTSWTEHPIDNEFEGARWVHAADLDGDGDLDVLGAATATNDITWWENLDGEGTDWAIHLIDGDFPVAVSVHAADLDGDGDLDVLGAGGTSFAGNDNIKWWENLNGTGTSWTGHTIDTNFVGAAFARAVDLDGDGDLDVLGAAYYALEIKWWENLDGVGANWTGRTIRHLGSSFAADAADLDADGDLDVIGTFHFADDVMWWENRGGQFALPTISLASTPLSVPVETAVLEIDAVHNGRAGDTDVELVSLELLFDDGTAPLTDFQANKVIETLYVYRDDGSGVFEPTDPLVLTLSSLSLNAGVQQVSVADGNPDAQVVFATPRRYFVVLDLVRTGLANTLRVTHVTESSSSGEDRDHDIPLKLEYSLNTSTPVIELVVGSGNDCPDDLVLANQTLTGTQTLKAALSATLGPNLIVDGDDIAVQSPVVSVLNNTTISGPFTIGNNPACP